jgi:hypothetical protein
MINFRTRNTRFLFLITIIYCLLFPIVIVLLTDMYGDFIFPLNHIIDKGRDFINIFYYGITGTNWGKLDIFAILYFFPCVLYWIVFPIIRMVGRWISRGN